MRVLVSAFTVVVCMMVAVGPTLGASAELDNSLILPEGTSRDVPQTIWFQGFLADASTGDPVNATYDIVAEMFSAESGGSSVWGVELHATTPIVEGWFNIELGATVALPDFASPPYYLELTINGELLAPRQKLASVPTALRAAEVDTPSGDSDWTIDGDDIYSAVSGNVGIGRSGPQRKLHIYEDVDGALSYPVKLENFGSGAGTATGILFKVDTGGEDHGKGAIAFERTNTWNRGKMHILVNNGGNYDVASLNDAVATFLPSGAVGIGTTEPGVKLEVNGHTRITNYFWPISGEGLELAYNADLNRGYVFAYDRDGAMDGQLALGSGNVGIGTANPTEQLQVAGVIHSTSGGFKFPDNSVQTSAASGGGLVLPYTGSTSSGASAFSVTNNGAGHGVYGKAVGALGRGVWGENTSTGAGVYGSTTSGTGVEGLSTSGMGVWGVSTSSYGVYGSSSTSYGVYGDSASVNGVRGQSTGAGRGVYGKHQTADYFGFMGGSDYGVYGGNEGDGGIYGYIGSSDDGVYGETDNPTGAGIYGKAGHHDAVGVHGEHTTTAYGLLGMEKSDGDDVGVYGGIASPPNYSGFFNGPVEMIGPVTKPMGSFKIDHPLDPLNMNLYHSFVESPDMMNIYNGNVMLDEGGEAWIELPEWFEALNQDFRYQLTCIGGFAQVYIADEIRGNRFRIAGGAPGMKVSWQVTGIRHDPYAEANRIQVEELKRPSHQGKYLHPEVYGQRRSMAVHRDSREVAAAGGE